MNGTMCTRCGPDEDYEIIERGQNKMAYCKRCKYWIKNIPYKIPQFYFGKYKGRMVRTVRDLSYLKWALGNTKPSKSLREAIEAQIEKLK